MNPVTDQKARVEEKSKSGASRENEDKKLENVKIIMHGHFKKPSISSAITITITLNHVPGMGSVSDMENLSNIYHMSANTVINPVLGSVT